MSSAGLGSTARPISTRWSMPPRPRSCRITASSPSARRSRKAAWLFITADESAHAQLLAEAAGKPRLIRHEVAEPLGRSRAFGGFSFSPYFEEIVTEQPDLLD